MKKQLYALFFSLLSSSILVNAQDNIFIDTSFTAEQMVMDFFSSDCVTPSNITFNGAPVSIGYFEAVNTALGVNAGIIITSGDATLAATPNDTSHAGINNGIYNYDVDLQSLADNYIYNDALLEFDIMVTDDAVLDFQYVFASEEYCEYAPPYNSIFNDVFGFFISGPGIVGPFSNQGINITTLPNGTPVTINNINPVTNPTYFLPNENYCGSFTDLNIQYDGWTTVLPAVFTATGNNTYHVKIGVADAGDPIFDSAIFLGIESLCGDSILKPHAEALVSAQGKTAQFQNKSRYGTSWHWNFGDGTISNQRNPPQHTYPDWGNYTVMLCTDNWCCSDTFLYELQLVEPLAMSVTAENATCYGAADGQLEAVINGGLPPFTFSLDSGASNSTGLFTGLTAGEYTVTVEDGNGTVIEGTAAISEPELEETFESVTVCFGEAYSVNGEEFTTAGNYEVEIPTQNGCTGLLHLTLEVLPETATAFQTSICENETYTWNGENYANPGNHQQVFTSATGCDSVVTLTLEVLPEPATSLSVAICENETYTWNGVNYSATGAYQQVFTSANGCDSTVTFTLEVLPEPATSLSVAICENDNYFWNGESYSDPGIYQQVFSSAHGCDSTVTLTLEVLPEPATSFPASICENETYTWNGVDYTGEGIYQQLFTSALGCDSTVTLTLEVLEVNNTSLSFDLCENDLSPLTGTPYPIAGIFTEQLHLMNQNGCDSVVTAQLTVHPIETLSEEHSVPFGFVFNGITLTHDTVIVTQGVNEFGCPVFTHNHFLVSDQLAISVKPENATCYGSADGELQVVITGGVPSYTFTLNDGASNSTGLFTGLPAGEYTVTVQDGNGSVVEGSAVIMEPDLVETFESATLCFGETYTVNGETYAASGNYDIEVMTPEGCTGILHLTLGVLPESGTSFHASICENETYFWNGVDYSDPGVYQQVFTSSPGCDSVVTLTLEVLEVNNTELTFDLCENDVSPLTGEAYPLAGVFTEQLLLTNQYGCDSLVTAQLTVHPAETLSDTVSVAYGFVFDGIELTHDTVVITQDVNEFGCPVFTHTQFLVGASATVDLANEAGLTVSPNPFSDELEIRFLLNESAMMSARLYDALGRRVTTPFTEGEFLPAGAYERRIATGHLPGGVYLLLVQVNGKSALVKVVKK